MAFFARFRRPDEPGDQPSLPAVLPCINQRVTLTRASGSPLPSRVDDEVDEGLVLLAPTAPLLHGEQIVITWEEDTGWYELETTVQAIEEDSLRPTITVAKRGHVQRFSERRAEVRRSVALPLDIRIVAARVVKPGRTLRTHTIEVSAQAIRFTTSAPLAPGDTVDIRIELPTGQAVGCRAKVIRMDSVSDSWRQICTAHFEDLLRSDRDLLLNLLQHTVEV